MSTKSAQSNPASVLSRESPSKNAKGTASLGNGIAEPVSQHTPVAARTAVQGQAAAILGTCNHWVVCNLRLLSGRSIALVQALGLYESNEEWWLSKLLLRAPSLIVGQGQHVR